MFLSGFLNNYRDIEIPIEDITQAYASWVEEHRYMILERLKPKWDSPKASTMFEKETIAVKCAKRGNDVYSCRVLSRFGMFEDLLTDLNLIYFDNGKMKTQVLFLTLTYDTNLRSRHQAWKTLSRFYNLFMSKMRRVFGSISTARTFEFFRNGYPHVHAVLLFSDFSFAVREYTDKKGRKVLLIDDDIKCADFDATDSKGVKTLAQCWEYRKRAYCLAGIFRRKMSDLIASMQNSNSRLTQETLDGGELEENKWSCLGFVSIDVLEVEPFIWRLPLSGELRERVCADLSRQEKETYD